MEEPEFVLLKTMDRRSARNRILKLGHIPQECILWDIKGHPYVGISTPNRVTFRGHPRGSTDPRWARSPR